MHRFHHIDLKRPIKSTVELSIYIHQNYRGRGIATQLMAHILEIAKNDPLLHNVVSVITAGNEGSTPSYTHDLALPIVV